VSYFIRFIEKSCPENYFSSRIMRFWLDSIKIGFRAMFLDNFDPFA